jgi:hypothetical protein
MVSLIRSAESASAKTKPQLAQPKMKLVKENRRRATKSIVDGKSTRLLAYNDNGVWKAALTIHNELDDSYYDLYLSEREVRDMVKAIEREKTPPTAEQKERWRQQFDEQREQLERFSKIISGKRTERRRFRGHS